MYADKLPHETEFFLYLLEHYAAHRGMDAGAMLRWWDQAGVTARVRDAFEIYHQEALDNAFADIDEMLGSAPGPDAASSRS